MMFPIAATLALGAVNTSYDVDDPPEPEFKVVTSGSCDPLESGGRYSWITTKAACEAAASTLGKYQTTIPAEQVDNRFYATDPPYCAYYPDGLPDGSAPVDSLWFLSPHNTGPCTPQRECICLDHGTALVEAAAEKIFGDGSVGTTVVVVIAAALLVYFCWRYMQRPRR